MSFFSNPRNIRPGPIEGNPLTGLCHRVAVSVKRILDCCCMRDTLENFPLELQGSTRLPPPVRFISAQSTSSHARVTNLSITRIRERPNFARVRCDVEIPLRVCYECADRMEHECCATVCVHEDIVLFIPGDSQFPFEIAATATAQATQGRVHSGEICATICCTVITKVVTEADLLLPTYGHLPPPGCVSFTQDACREFFDLPLYPQGDPSCDTKER